MNFNVTDNLSEEQLNSFNIVKKRIVELHGAEEAEDEPRLLRFLIARDFDVDKSTAMLSDSIKWRRKYGINDILQTFKPSQVFDTYYPATFFGFSNEGDAVVLTDFKSADLIGFGKSFSKSEFIMSITYLLEGFCEQLRENSEKEGKLCDTWIFIMDFDKTPLSQVTNKGGMDLLLSLFPIYEANYPERLKTAYIINASTTFTIAYSLLSPLLYEKTRNKVKVFGKNGWQEQLTKVMNPKILPAYLGGTRTDPDGDPLCTSFVKRGSIIPERYYTSKSMKNISSKPGVKKFVVSRLSRATIKLEVSEPGSKIEWEFQTENYEIGFGLRFTRKDDIGNKISEDVIPVQKMDTRVFCETGMFLCEKPGTYVILFDNSFSWLRSKELYVRADIISPDGSKQTCLTSRIIENERHA